MTATVLGVVGGAAALTVWIDWFRRLNQVRVPRERLPWQIAVGIGGAVGLLALTGEPGWFGGTLAVIGVLGAVMFIGLGLTSAQAKVQPNVTVGEPILDFTAPDAEDRPFDLAKLRGKPFLLKFFRGHW